MRGQTFSSHRKVSTYPLPESAWSLTFAAGQPFRKHCCVCRTLKGETPALSLSLSSPLSSTAEIRVSLLLLLAQFGRERRAERSQSETDPLTTSVRVGLLPERRNAFLDKNCVGTSLLRCVYRNIAACSDFPHVRERCSKLHLWTTVKREILIILGLGRPTHRAATCIVRSVPGEERQLSRLRTHSRSSPKCS